MMWARFLIAAAAVIGTSVAGWHLYEAGSMSGRKEVQQMWDRERAAMAQAQAEETMKARQRELALQGLVTRLRREQADEANRLAAEYTADLERLRDRPEARAGAGGVPDSPDAGVGCTGEGLARGDAEFLSRYALDAARLQFALNACQVAYDEVRRSLVE